LQTEDYARAIISVGRPKMSSDEIERLVALRMTRQEILEVRDGLPADQEQTPRYWAIMDESALQRTVGSAEIMRAQYEHLAEMALRPYITIQVISNEKGPTSAYGRAFTILVSQNNSAVVYLEDPNSAHYVRDRDDVNRYSLIFDHLRARRHTDTTDTTTPKRMRNMNWRKSSYSGQGGGNCVEVADSTNRVLVRDTQDRSGPTLRVTPDVWRKFAAKVKTS
jgi:Domain of unknown function (DUF5753)/Domain of unknown function (DUF397)